MVNMPRLSLLPVAILSLVAFCEGATEGNAVCGQQNKWREATVGNTKKNVKTLTGLQSAAVIGPSSQPCLQVACHKSSIVEWCNNNDFEVTFSGGFPAMADVVSDIITSCAENRPRVGDLSDVVGEIAIDDGTIVRVRRDSCHVDI